MRTYLLHLFGDSPHRMHEIRRPAVALPSTVRKFHAEGKNCL
jgi:hypothetical protein